MKDARQPLAFHFPDGIIWPIASPLPVPSPNTHLQPRQHDLEEPALVLGQGVGGEVLKDGEEEVEGVRLRGAEGHEAREDAQNGLQVGEELGGACCFFLGGGGDGFGGWV